MIRDLVDAGDGVRLAVHRSGFGTPAVICLSCAGGAHDEWSAVAARLQTVTEVVTYGRPSLGGSDPLPRNHPNREQSVLWSATQLRTLLTNSSIAPPYVLLTSSIGSWIADRYAAAWPDEVGGIVLVDPTMVTAWPQLGWREPVVDGGDAGCCRWDWTDGFDELTRHVPRRDLRCVVVSGSDGHWERNPTGSAWHEPLTLAEVDLLWQESQREWVDRLSALHVVADTAGHFVHRDEPDLVVSVTAAVVEAERAAVPIDLDPARVAAVGGWVERPVP